MSYRLITFSVLLFLLGHIFVWMQLFMEATRLTIEGFEGLFWPGRFVAFVCGITIFTLFTYLFKGEAITLKTATSLLLAFSIIIIQLFWK